MPDGAASRAEQHDPYSALRYAGFRLLLSGGVIASLGQQMVSIALGWELYDRTHSALALGGIGLAQIIPIILISLPAGHIADHYSRKLVISVAQGVLSLASLALAALSYQHGALLLVYACLVVIGAAQAFSNPSGSALLAQVIPESEYESATTWRSSAGQVAFVLGPAAGGFLIGLLHGATAIYLINAVTAMLYVLLLSRIQVVQQQRQPLQQRTVKSVLDGLAFLRRTPVLLAAITLDLFAVLLGGATTLLPIYARDILHVGPIGLGWLQASGSLGAVSMALLLAHRSRFSQAGRALLLAVSGFGVATIIFGLSHGFWLSFVALFVLGALDNISVVIRSTLVLVRTPDAMRGRVGAVNWLFISTSNQLGGFESGLAAQMLGPIAAVVAGGIGTILVVLLVAWRWPEMRNLTTLSETVS